MACRFRIVLEFKIYHFYSLSQDPKLKYNFKRCKDSHYYLIFNIILIVIQHEVS
jgi:hypothetical protein